MLSFDGRTLDGKPVRVQVSAQHIAAIKPIPEPQDYVLPWITPPLVDLQVNGYAGIDLNAQDLSAEDVVQVVKSEWANGVGTFCPTIISGPQGKMLHSLRMIAAARSADPLVSRSIPRIHIEGPYLSSADGPRGAHDLASMRAPSLTEFEQWQLACGGAIGIVTMAPETDGALDYIRVLSQQGVVVSLGHTAAEPEVIRAAVDAGARMSTHLGNGAHAELPRHPNYIWAQLANDRLVASFIADGHHLPADTFRAMLRAKGIERSLLVSDSVAFAGCEPGTYDDASGAGRVTVTADGSVVMTGTPYLAGSGSSLLDCVGWARKAGALNLETVIRLASANSLSVLGLPGGNGPRVGDIADFVLLSERGHELVVDATILSGTIVHRAAPA